MRAPAVLLASVAAAAGCVDAFDAPPEVDVIDIRRIDASVAVRRSHGGVETLRLDVVVAGGHVVLTAGALTIDAISTGPGIPITATVQAGPDTLAIRNDLVTLGDVTYRISDWRDRNAVVTGLGRLPAVLAAVAPYRTAIEARLAEAAPVFAAVSLFQAWPDGVEPAWPALDDPRDGDPPGHLDGDLIGLGMTCSTAIRCPNSAPYCVTRTHADDFGVCTRACAASSDCGAGGRCSLSVADIPDVPATIQACELPCGDTACPGLLACEVSTETCAATQDH